MIPLRGLDVFLTSSRFRLIRRARASVRYSPAMNNDIVFVALSFAFFILSALYAHFCEKVR